jgi:hypothetical protein
VKRCGGIPGSFQEFTTSVLGAHANDSRATATAVWFLRVLRIFLPRSRVVRIS